MMVFMRANLVVWVGDVPPLYLDYDAFFTSAPANVAVGQVFNGSAFVAPVAGSEQANRAALADQADTALATNLQAIADAQAWLATNTGTLTTAQLSNAMRSVMNSMVTAAKQRNGIIRLLRGRFEATN